VTWIDFRRHRTIGRVRIAALGGRAHTIASLQLGRDEVDAFQLAEAQLSGNNGYWVDWTAYGGFVHTDVHRYTGLGHHVHTILFDLYNDVGDQGGVPHVAADGNRLYYVGRRGIYLAAPARLHCQCGQHDEQG
jgi:hypothetical protein